MTDISLLWDDDGFEADIALEDGQLATDEGLHTAIILSLFTDARAAPDDALPDPGADPRGWWGNAFPAATGQREMGSKLWLLERAKTLTTVLTDARDYARDALQWLVDDRIVASIDVTAERQTRDATDLLALRVRFTRPTGQSGHFDTLWRFS